MPMNLNYRSLSEHGLVYVCCADSIPLKNWSRTVFGLVFPSYTISSTLLHGAVHARRTNTCHDMTVHFYKPCIIENGLLLDEYSCWTSGRVLRGDFVSVIVEAHSFHPPMSGNNSSSIPFVCTACFERMYSSSIRLCSLLTSLAMV